MAGQVHAHAVVIADTETESEAINVEGRRVVGLSIGTVAATAATFTATYEVVATPKGNVATPTFRTVRTEDGTSLSVTTTDDSHIEVEPRIGAATQVKIVANVAASGDETWVLLTRSGE